MTGDKGGDTPVDVSLLLKPIICEDAFNVINKRAELTQTGKTRA